MAPAILLDPFDYNERYIEPRLGWSVDLPAELAPIALVTGLFVAAVLTYHDVRRKAGKPDVVFEVREFDFLLNSRAKDRPEQPFNMAEVNLRGRLRNRGEIKTDVEGARVALMERGWLWRWGTVDEQKPIKIFGPLKAVIDLVYHGVSVDGHSPSRDISEMWCYLSIPVSVKPDSKRAYRLRILVDAYGQNQATPMYEAVNLADAFRAGEASFQRVDEIRGRTSESVQSTGEPPPQ